MSVKEFARAGHWPTLLSAFLYFDIRFMVRVLLGAVGVFVAQDFGLTALPKRFLVFGPATLAALLSLLMVQHARRVSWIGEGANAVLARAEQ